MVGKANFLVVFSQRGDAVVEFHAGVSVAQFPYFEGVRSLLIDIQTLAIAVGSQEYVILHLGVDSLDISRIQLYRRYATHQLDRKSVV